MEYKAVIWGIGATYNHMVNTLTYFEMKKELKVVALTATTLSPYQKIDGFPILSVEEIQHIEYDLLIIMNKNNYKEIVQDAVSKHHIPREKIISYKILQIPKLNIEKYIELKKSRISIISNNCWGGIAYHTLGLEVLSPFKNLFVLDHDYIRLLGNLQHYLACDLQFYKFRTDVHSQEQYPVFYLDDIQSHCNHDNDIDTAIEKWSRRRAKINWDNLFIEMYTDSPQVESEFMNASVYSKRVCFVPYASSYKDSFQLKMGHDQKEFWEAVNGNASNGKSSFAYDLIGLLLGDEECKNRSILK